MTIKEHFETVLEKELYKDMQSEKITCPNIEPSVNLEIRYDTTEEPDILVISESFANKLKQPIIRKEEVKMEKGDKITGRYGSKDVNKDYILNNYNIIRYDAYSMLEEFFGKEKLEKIIKFDIKAVKKGIIYGRGIKYFEDYFIYIIEYYENADNTHLYDNIMKAYDTNSIFTSSLNTKLFSNYNADDLLYLLDMNVSHLVDTINSSDDEMEILENLYLLQKNMNFICNYHNDKLKNNEKNDNNSESKDVNGINPFPTSTKERYSCCCSFTSGNKLMYDKLGKDYRCPICNTKLFKVREVE